MDAAHFSSDILEFIRLLFKHEAEYVIVGGEAVIYYGHARLTGDVDFFYGISPENAGRMMMALNEFWEDSIPGNIEVDDLTKEEVIIQFGQPPNRIDLVNKIDGVVFEDVWPSRKVESILIGRDECQLYYIDLDSLIKNKEAAHRPRDMEDLKYLKSAAKGKK